MSEALKLFQQGLFRERIKLLQSQEESFTLFQLVPPGFQVIIDFTRTEDDPLDILVFTQFFVVIQNTVEG